MEDVKDRIETLVAQFADQPELAAKTLSDLHIEDVIEALNLLAPDAAIKIFQHLPEEMLVRVFNAAGLDRPSRFLEQLPEDRAALLLSRVHPDRRAEIYRGLSRTAQDRLFDRLDGNAKTSLNRILEYPADKAGGIMTTEFVSVPAGWTVKQVLDHIRARGHETAQIYAVYVVEPQSQRLLQTVSLRELLIANPRQASVRPRPKESPSRPRPAPAVKTWPV